MKQGVLGLGQKIVLESFLKTLPLFYSCTKFVVIFISPETCSVAKIPSGLVPILAVCAVPSVVMAEQFVVGPCR